VILFDRLAKTRTSLRGGSVHNALPRCCSTTFCLQPRLAWFVVHRVFHRQGKNPESWKLKAATWTRTWCRRHAKVSNDIKISIDTIELYERNMIDELALRLVHGELSVGS
jgi:hypothetical protein